MPTNFFIAPIFLCIHRNYEVDFLRVYTYVHKYEWWLKQSIAYEWFVTLKATYSE